MVASPDFQDFTQGSSRLMQQLVGSPAASSVAGVNSVTLAVPDFARSLNLLVTTPANVITLTVVGATTGFTYLNAVPAYDGGIYYLPAMPVVDTQVTLTWYQVAATAVSIYAIASDEPISVSIFNPVNPTTAFTEKTEGNGPTTCSANALTTLGIILDVTTNAVRCSVDIPANYLWGQVKGDQSGTLYFDGTATNTKFPVTPIPVDHTADTSVSVTVRTTVAGTCRLYVTAINAPDFAGSIPFTQAMTTHELAPTIDRIQIPNQAPAIFDGTIAASAVQSLVTAVAGRQLRLHAIFIMQYGSTTNDIDLEDTNGNKFLHYHWTTSTNISYLPLFGQLASVGAGIQLRNLLAALTGAVAITLWYSVL